VAGELHPQQSAGDASMRASVTLPSRTSRTRTIDVVYLTVTGDVARRAGGDVVRL
jgi:hypothetical protein